MEGSEVLFVCLFLFVYLFVLNGKTLKDTIEGLERWLRSYELRVLSILLGYSYGLDSYMLTTAYNSSSRRFDTLFWPPHTLGMHMVYRFPCRQNTVHIKIRVLFCFVKTWLIYLLLFL